MAFLKPDHVKTFNGVTVKEFFLNKHNDNKISLPCKRSNPYLGPTLHNTGRINAAAGTTCSEQYTRSTYNGNMKTVVPTFYVDDVEAWQLLPLDFESWCSGHSGCPAANGSNAGNAQSINIECIMDGSGSAKDLKARDNAARLIAYLLDTMGGNLYTHNYWENIRIGRTGSIDELNKKNDGYKGCPIFIRPKWDDFKALVKKYRTATTATTTASAADPDVLYRIQLGAFSVKANADAYLKEVKKAYPDAFISGTVKK